MIIDNEDSAYLKTVFDTMMDGLMVVNQKGTIRFVNKAMEVLTGYSKGELIGKDCTVIGCDICFRSAHGKTVKHCVLFRSGKIFKERCTLIKKNGTPLVVWKNATVLRDENGQVVGGVETLTDMTEILEKDQKIAHFSHVFTKKDGLAGIKGKSRIMQHVFELVRGAAKSDFPVIIFGESGTGKEKVASAIHKLGNRRRGPLVKVNCAALSETLLESELFGHVRGAFTGADRLRKGRFEVAHGGDIFLDEIGDMPLATQVRLLRVLQEMEIERVGDHTPISIDVRVLSATHQDLWELVKKGKFREDLYYRLNVIAVHIPPLRERKEDLPLLIEAFLSELRAKTGKQIEGISRHAMRVLRVYSWPGNIRELINALEYAFVVCPGETIHFRHLPKSVTSSHKRMPYMSGDFPSREDTLGALERWDRNEKWPGRDVSDIEQVILALEEANGKKNEAANILGISRQALWKKIRKYGIEVKKIITTE
jgi:two-component system response regulator HydG